MLEIEYEDTDGTAYTIECDWTLEDDYIHIRGLVLYVYFDGDWRLYKPEGNDFKRWELFCTEWIQDHRIVDEISRP